MSCDLTLGLYFLNFLSKPENFDDQDLKMYKIIILETNIHRVGFKPNSRKKGTRAYKYSHIIKKLIDKDTSFKRTCGVREHLLRPRLFSTALATVCYDYF